MPIYEYRCESCEHKLEKLQRMSDGDLVDCPECEQPALKRLVSAAAFRLKGSGWYETDFKKDNRREPFDAKKILDGLRKACQKRDISTQQLEEITDRIERSLMERGGKEVLSSEVGEQIMLELHDLDQVAYVRFASVYRSFKDLNDFMEEVKTFLERREQSQKKVEVPE